MAIDADLPFVSSTIAWSELIRDYDWAGAKKTFRNALLVQEDNTNVLHWLSHTVSWQGHHEEALKHARRAGQVEDGAASIVSYTTIIGGDPVAARQIGDMMIAYAKDGTVGNVSADLISSALLGSEDLGQILAFVGDSEGTLRALRQAADDRSGSHSVLSMKINPAYDFIRDDPGFTAILKQIGLN